MNLNGKTVLITGASRGIGAEMAKAFAAAGSKVVLAARSSGAIDQLAAELDGHAFTLDVADDAQLDGFIDRVQADVGPIDVLINNAGVESGALVGDLDESTYGELTQINLIAPQRLTHQVVDSMIERGEGHLVFTSSVAASTPSPGLAPYCASKAGLTMFANTLRMELKGTGVGVTALHLGPIDTDMWDRVVDNPVMNAAQKRLRRMGLLTTVAPEKVAADTVAAVEDNRREVRHPKRLMSTFALAAAPTRMTESLLVGFTPRKQR